MKDYSGIVDPDRKGRLRSAMNNAAAFNRLYGAGSANVMMRKTANPLQKAVSVKLRRISGASLADILAQGNIGLAEKAVARYAKGDVATQLAKKNLNSPGSITMTLISAIFSTIRKQTALA